MYTHVYTSRIGNKAVCKEHIFGCLLLFVRFGAPYFGPSNFGPWGKDRCGISPLPDPLFEGVCLPTTVIRKACARFVGSELWAVTPPCRAVPNAVPETARAPKPSKINYFGRILGRPCARATSGAWDPRAAISENPGRILGDFPPLTEGSPGSPGVPRRGSEKGGRHSS